MKNSVLTLFESTTACFRLSINTMYERLKTDGTTQSAVYINPVKQSGIFRPSVFLVFTYLTNDFQTTKGIWTTVPHMYKIRQSFQLMHDIANNEASYISINNETNVSPDYAAPVVADGIGKNQDWISLTLTMASDENSMSRRPCVAIQHSKSNSFSSLLTLDEFNTIYDIIMHIDFVTLENQAVLMELVSRNSTHTSQTNYNSVPNYNNVAPQSYQRNANYANYSQPMGRQKIQPSITVVPAPAVAPTTTTPGYASPAQSAVKLPPRPAEKVEHKKPMMTPTEIESIEVDEDMIDDSSLVDDIFAD